MDLLLLIAQGASSALIYQWLEQSIGYIITFVVGGGIWKLMDRFLAARKAGKELELQQNTQKLSAEQDFISILQEERKAYQQELATARQGLTDAIAEVERQGRMNMRLMDELVITKSIVLKVPVLIDSLTKLLDQLNQFSFPNSDVANTANSIRFQLQDLQSEVTHWQNKGPVTYDELNGKDNSNES